MQINTVTPDYPDIHYPYIAVPHVSPGVTGSRDVPLTEYREHFMALPDNKADLTKFLLLELMKQLCGIMQNAQYLTLCRPTTAVSPTRRI